MNCIYCETHQPAKGFFCPNCFKQTKCKHCDEVLLKDTPICVFCGEQIGAKIQASNINTIEFSETEKGRNFKASFTDTVGQSISDSFGMILSNKTGSKLSTGSTLSLDNASNNENKTEDVEVEVVNDVPKVLIPELEQLKKVFKEDGESISLLETRLKAKSKKDYGIRLTLLFLYYKHLAGFDNVSRSNLTAILDDASVEDGNLRSWIGNNPLIGISNNQVHIKAPGKDAAKEYMAEMLNPEIKDKWQIGTTSKVGRKTKDKKEKTS
jgi:hypothetical protein